MKLPNFSCNVCNHGDRSLLWNTFIIYIIISLFTKAVNNASLYIINKVKHEIPYIALKTLYYSLFHSHVTYGISVWGSSELIKKVTILQKKIIRIIHNKPFRSHTDMLFKRSEILKVTDIYKLQCTLFVHDYICIINYPCHSMILSLKQQIQILGNHPISLGTDHAPNFHPDFQNINVLWYGTP